MKNNKAFTMIELIVVIIIIGVILVFAIPNLVKTLEENKKKSMFIDAESFVDLTKKCIVGGRKLSSGDICQYPSTSKEYTLSDIDYSNSITDSAYGKTYDRTNSKVTVTFVSGEYKYYVELIDADGNTCAMEYGDSKCSG